MTNFKYQDSTHTYTIDGEKIPSVTSILSKVLAKPALLPWGIKATAEHYDGIMKKYQEGEFSKIDDKIREDFLKEAKGASKKVSSDAATFGSAIHQRIERVIKKQIRLEGVEDEYLPYLRAFFDWYKQEKIKQISTEKKLYSTIYRYAGTLDAVAKIDDEVIIYDYKTSSGFYPEYDLQISAYAKAYEERYGTKIDKCKIVRIDKKSTKIEVVEFDNIDELFEVFLNILNIYKFLYENNKT